RTILPRDCNKKRLHRGECSLNIWKNTTKKEATNKNIKANTEKNLRHLVSPHRKPKTKNQKQHLVYKDFKITPETLKNPKTYEV
ncbi:MAG: hypothetical protein Q6367_008705, partial [Candidatus Freyarchaeota archaeon]